jgi:hypothetical protein
MVVLAESRVNDGEVRVIDHRDVIVHNDFKGTPANTTGLSIDHQFHVWGESFDCASNVLQVAAMPPLITNRFIWNHNPTGK